MTGVKGQTRADNQGRPARIPAEERQESFQQKGEILLIRVPATDRDNLIFFSNGRIGTENIRLNGVGNAVNPFRVRSYFGGQLLPKLRGLGGFHGERG